jgi:hypothetical protein
MIRIIPINCLSYKMEAGINGMGSKLEKEREEQIKLRE